MDRLFQAPGSVDPVVTVAELLVLISDCLHYGRCSRSDLQPPPAAPSPVSVAMDSVPSGSQRVSSHPDSDGLGLTARASGVERCQWPAAHRPPPATAQSLTASRQTTRDSGAPPRPPSPPAVYGQTNGRFGGGGAEARQRCVQACRLVKLNGFVVSWTPCERFASGKLGCLCGPKMFVMGFLEASLGPCLLS